MHHPHSACVQFDHGKNGAEDNDMPNTIPHRFRPCAKWTIAIAAPLLALATAGHAANEEAGHVAARACVPGEPSIIVQVRGFKTDSGMVRAQLYGPDPDNFLDKGKWVTRIEKRRDGQNVMHFCFPVAAPGRYAIAIRHDANDNGRSDWNDGGGFSRNPDLSLFHMKPDFKDVAVGVNGAPVKVDIVMQYRQGLSIKPIS